MIRVSWSWDACLLCLRDEMPVRGAKLLSDIPDLIIGHWIVFGPLLIEWEGN